VVDPGAAAADLRLFELDELESRHGSQQGPRRLADALRVPQVAGVLIGGPRPDGSEVAIEVDGRQELGHVFEARAESLRALEVLPLLLLEKLRVFLQDGAAPGGIGDNRVEVAAEKRLKVLPGKLAGDVSNTGVDVQRSAAPLLLWDHHLAAVPRQ